MLALLEAHAHFGDRRWGELALRGTRWLAAAIDTWRERELSVAVRRAAGMAFALHEAAGVSATARRDEAAARAAAMRGWRASARRTTASAGATRSS